MLQDFSPPVHFLPIHPTNHLTDDEDEEGGGSHEADVSGRAPGLADHIRVAFRVVVEVVSHSIAPDLLVHVRRQLHLHLAVVTFHVLGQVETCVGARLPIKLLR